METAWDPHSIVDDFRFVDHIMSSMHGAAMAGEARLTENVMVRIRTWGEEKEWGFEVVGG
jgi:hypothetical protein